MKNAPRILPLAGVAIGGVLAINALSGARALPDLLSGARAFAEDSAKPEKGAKSEKGAKDEKAAKDEAAKPSAASAEGAAKDAGASVPPSIRPVAVCAPTAAELAKEAGLSPAELQVLQSLGARRGQLDQREQQLDVQIALLAAAEAKLDAKVKALNGLKGDISGLLAQADAKDQAEADRMVKVFEGMKPKDAAPRIVLLDDSVRLPIAAKMKERALSAILAAMPPMEAKKLTEALSRRFTAAKSLAAAASAQANAPASDGSAPPEAAARAPAPKSPPKSAPKAQAAASPPAAAAKPAAEPAPKAG